MSYRSIAAVTRFATHGDGRIAYRSIGSGEAPPLFLLQRYQGSIDDWDPDLLERLSARRQVVVFDYPGIGYSTGTSPSDFAGFVDVTLGLAQALGIERADVLGWSFSNFTASHLALIAPGFVRRLILAGGSPGYLEHGPKTPVAGARIGVTHGANDGDYAYLFFAHDASGKAAATDHLKRMRARSDFFRGPLAADALANQLVARGLLMTPQGSLLSRFTEIGHETLVLHGMADIRMPPIHGFSTAQAIRNAGFIGYPRLAHGFLFEQPERVAADIVAFLA